MFNQCIQQITHIYSLRAGGWKDKPDLLRFAEDEPDLLIMPTGIKSNVNTRLVGKTGADSNKMLTKLSYIINFLLTPAD